MNNSCGCKECSCSPNADTLNFVDHSWDIPDSTASMRVPCYCIACDQECNTCECTECSCSDDIDHLETGEYLFKCPL